MGKRVIAIAVATVIALVGALLAFMYARGADQRAIEGQAAKPVYVSTAIVPAGTSLKDALNLGLLQPTQVAAKAFPAGAIQKVDQRNQDLVAVADLPPGQYVLGTAFGQERVGTKAINVPPGKLAVSVSLQAPARVGNFVTPGRHITIFQTYRIKQFGASDEVKAFNDLEIKGTSVLLPDVTVIGMGNTTNSVPVQPSPSPDAAGQQPPQDVGLLVTLAVTPEEAVRLVHGINAPYTLYAGLLGDNTVVEPRLSTDDRGYFGGTQP